MTTDLWVALLLVALAFFYVLLAIWVLDRRAQRQRRRRNAVFLTHMAVAMRQRRRIRPKVDARIQRRRFAR